MQYKPVPMQTKSMFGKVISALFGVVLIIGSGAVVNRSKPVTAAAPTPSTTNSTQTLSSEEWAFLPLINDFRAQNGLAPLQVSSTLTTSSKWLSNDMATKNYFSHTDSLGRNPQVRMQAYGYTANATGENIAAGFSSAQDVLTAWENSPDHRANMLSPNYTVIGIGRVELAGSQYGTYWTTDFGSTVDQVLSPDGSNVTIPATATPMPISQPTNLPTPQTRIGRRQHANITQSCVSGNASPSLFQRLFHINSSQSVCPQLSSGSPNTNWSVNMMHLLQSL